ncbi:MAG: ABC transporter permease [Corynebacterium sp.]|uniref:ABC transporter permease n=1 Tax=Corynebacterium sp. TaxID=1720 RepID=UPI0026DC8CB3|nr:ABC transporter permease [Corynebacterium sp.]MDO5097751.1 ABC transporter permease [Corynebacterium sp.]
MDTTERHVAFPPGTFSPRSTRSSWQTMLRAQSAIEAKLFLRHGEQLLLSFIIPIAMLIIVGTVKVFPQPQPLSIGFPFVLAIAAMSSGFTGQAISLAFDRRYGALKRVGASGVPTWTIILGKICGLVIVSTLQISILVTVATVLGWRASVGSFLLGILLFFLGIAAFTALGMLLGGTLSSEIVLGLANLLWVILVGAAGYVMFSLPEPTAWLTLVPSIALATGIHTAFSGGFPLISIVALICWTVISVAAAIKWFKFTD